MAIKDFLAKLLLGSDIHEDLAASEREKPEGVCVCLDCKTRLNHS